MKRQRGETFEERHKRDEGKETKGTDREKEEEMRDGGEETEGRYIGGETKEKRQR